MSAAEVVVVGAVNVDLVVAVPSLPGPGETVVGPGLERHGGGKGANAAVAAARAGARVRLVGAVGDDDLGAGAVADLVAEGVDTSAVATEAGASTGVALIVVDSSGDNQIAVAAGANAAVDPGRVAGAVRRAGAGAVVVVSTEISLEAAAAAVRAAAEVGARCVLDPAPALPALADLLDAGPLLTPNATECRQLAGAAGGPAGDATPLGDAAAWLAGRTGAAVVVTLGADGVLVADGGDVARRPARPAAVVVDATGAGDTFTGVLAAWLAGGARLDDAVDAALVAASLSVGSTGARAGMPAEAVIRRSLA